MKKVLVNIILLGFGIWGLGFIAGCGQQQTSTSGGGGGSTGGNIIRLYYTYPTDSSKGGKGYTSQNFGSAYSSDGINFTAEAGARLGPVAYLSDPDVFKYSSNNWIMFYSKAVTSEASVNSKLFKATCSTSNGAFSDDPAFVGNLGNISSTIKIGNTFYVYTVSNGIKVCTYDPSKNTLSLVGTAISPGADPSVIQLSTNSFKMYYKDQGDTYSMDSTDGTTWSNKKLLISNAEVPGTVYVNNKIYLYYSGGGSTKVLLRISSDNGATFSTSQEVAGLPDGACDPDPVIYE